MLKQNIQSENNILKNPSGLFSESISCALLHDLINPISGLTLYLENTNDLQIGKILRPLNKASKDIRDFINLVMQEREEPNRVEILNLQKVTEHVISLMRHKAIKNDVSIVMSREQINNLLVMNKVKFYQVLINLISNAIDSTKNVARNKKVVALSFTKNGEGLLITVTDNGCGIPKENYSKIFSPCFTTKRNGSGIGLCHTKEIIERNFSGTISFKSVLNKGTTFNVKIPPKHLV